MPMNHPSSAATIWNQDIRACDHDSCQVITTMDNFYSGGSACAVGNHRIAMLPYLSTNESTGVPTTTTDFIILDLRYSLFTTYSSQPSDREFSSCSHYLNPDTGSEYLVVAGDSGFDGLQTAVYEFATNAWTVVAALASPVELRYPGFFTWNRELYRFGGGNSKVSKLDKEFAGWNDLSEPLANSGPVLLVVQHSKILREIGDLSGKTRQHGW